MARPEHLLRKIMWPTNTFSFCRAKRLRKLRVAKPNSPRRASITRRLRLHEVNPTLVHFARALVGVLS